jgi:T4 superinfection immunity protein
MSEVIGAWIDLCVRFLRIAMMAGHSGASQGFGAAVAGRSVADQGGVAELSSGGRRFYSSIDRRTVTGEMMNNGFPWLILPMDAGSGFMWLMLLLGLYFLPTIVAANRKVPNRGSITVINIFLGWIFVA